MEFFTEELIRAEVHRQQWGFKHKDKILKLRVMEKLIHDPELK
jgi:hypothetical protein